MSLYKVILIRYVCFIGSKITYVISYLIDRRYYVSNKYVIQYIKT
jgi:hypothetical protein